MINTLHNNKSVLTAMLASLLLLAGPVQSAGVKGLVKTIKPYALFGYTYDSNLLRLSGDEEALALLGITDLSDQIATYEFGIETLFETGVHEFELTGQIYQKVYRRFSGTDHAGGNALASWGWSGGDRWNTKLGYRYNRNLRDFANQVVPRKDIRTRNSLFGEIGRRFGQRNKLTLRANAADIYFLDNFFLDHERLAVTLSYDYFVRSGNSIGLDAIFSDATFENNSSADYQDITAGPTLHWVMSGKSRLDGYVAYTQREYENSPSRDYDGFTGRFSIDWQGGQDSKVKFSVYRELSNLGDEISNYAIVDGISIEPTWQISPRAGLRFLLSYEDRDFQGEPNLLPPVPLLEQRRDKVATGGLWFEWKSRTAWTFSLGVRAEDRSSNRVLNEYEFQAVEGQIQFGW